MLELRSKEFELARRLPAKIVYQLTGVCLPFFADDFDRVIVTPVWTAYPEKARQRLMKELIRVVPRLTFLSDDGRESALDALKAEIEPLDVSVEAKKIANSDLLLLYFEHGKTVYKGNGVRAFRPLMDPWSNNHEDFNRSL